MYSERAEPAPQHGGREAVECFTRRRENMVGVNMVLADFIMLLKVLC